MCSRLSRHFLSAAKVLRKSTNSRLCTPITYCKFSQARYSSSDKSPKNETNQEIDDGDKSNLLHVATSKYKIFRDEDSEVIFDVDEERKKISLDEINVNVEYQDPYEGLNMERGVTGVYDIEDLVEFLKANSAPNIVVISVPSEMAYADYVVITQGKSFKHMAAIVNFIRKGYKLKRRNTDPIPKVEGKDSKDWMALDLGNIVLHIFSYAARTAYDLETLWTVGSKYDDKTLNDSKGDEMFEMYGGFLRELRPADS